jgi:hypothetical protein
MSKLDLNNINQQLIVVGMAGLVEDEGLTPHEVFQLLEEIKQNTIHALIEMHREAKR